MVVDPLLVTHRSSPVVVSRARLQGRFVVGTLNLVPPVSRSAGLLSALVVPLVLAPPALAQSPRARHTRASLLSETDAVRPGRPLTVGIRLQMEKDWHTYWRNPGDSGLPTRARWEVPAGFAAGEIQWPYPSRFTSGPLVNYGYEGEVLLPVEIRVPASVPESQVRIAARVDWLECQEACLPGRAELSLTLPVRATSAPTAEGALFADVRRRLPRKDPAWGFSVSSTARSVSLVVRPPRGTELREAYFYPAVARVLDHARPQTLTREGTANRLALARDPNAAPLERLAGVLVAGTGTGLVAVAVDVPLARGAARTSLNQERGS
jgi:thiol:disulfide interchange protein DsbD